MKSIQKIGLTALAGSMIAVSANAVEMTVAGTAEATYTTNSGTGGTNNTNTGNPLGLNTFISFNGSGELDNGNTVSFFSSLTEAGARTSASLSYDMGDMGTLILDQSTDAGGISKINNMIPTAYEEADHLTGSGAGDLDLNGSESVIAFNNTYGGMDVSVEYNPGTDVGTMQGDGVAQGDSTGSARNFSVKGPLADGVTFGVGYGEEDTNALDKDGTEWGAYVNYVTGPISLGIGTGDVQNNTALANGNKYLHYGIAFAVNDNISVSLGRDDVDVMKTGLANVTEESTGLDASYTMGSASVRAHVGKTDNYLGASGDTKEVTEISLILSF
jgi:outer membrane protein OmpU